MKKQSYIRPEIWLDELTTENSLLGASKEVTSVSGNGGFIYGGHGNGGARAGENDLWDDENENDDSNWDQL